jgi:hypothetical protein
MNTHRTYHKLCRAFGAALLLPLATAHASVGVSVQNVTAYQRSPWNGQADGDYEITGTGTPAIGGNASVDTNHAAPSTCFVERAASRAIAASGNRQAAAIVQPWNSLPPTARSAAGATTGVLLVDPATSAFHLRYAGTMTFFVDSFSLGEPAMPWTAEIVSGGEWARIVSGASSLNRGMVTVAYDLFDPPGYTYDGPYPDGPPEYPIPSGYYGYDPSAPMRSAEIRFYSNGAVNSPEIRGFTQSASGGRIVFNVARGPDAWTRGWLLGSRQEAFGTVTIGNGSPLPWSIAIAPDGSLYATHVFSVRKIIPSGNTGAFCTLDGLVSCQFKIVG